MSGHLDAERILDAYLAPDSDRLPDRVLDAALAHIARTPQRRALRAPWRFPTMPALTRATGIAAVALVAVVGAGGILFLNSNNSGDVGAQKTPAPTSGPTTAPTTVPTIAPTPRPSEVAKGIFSWKTYTSALYGYTISYPEDWSIADRATRKWQPRENDEGTVDTFVNNEVVDGGSIAYFALQFPAPAGADLGSWHGLLAAMTEMCAKPADFYFNACPIESQLTRLCLGSLGCQPVAIVHYTGEQPRALFGDPDTGIFTYIQAGRDDDFPAAARYGGTVMLLKEILGEMGVREPRPGESPN